MQDPLVPPRQVRITAPRFWIDFEADSDGVRRLDGDGKLIPVEMVEWSYPDRAHMAALVDKVSRVSKVKGGRTHPVWDVLKPYYEAWKSGQDMPTVGTPLHVWSALPSHIAEVFKVNQMRTVEDIAEATDSQLARIPLPGARNFKDHAKRFLEAKDTARAEAAIVARDEAIKALEARLAAMEARAQDEADDDGEGEPVRRRRRRSREAAEPANEAA